VKKKKLIQSGPCVGRVGERKLTVRKFEWVGKTSVERKDKAKMLPLKK